MWLRDAVPGSPDGVWRWSRRWPGGAHPTAIMPGRPTCRPRSRCCWPITCSPTHIRCCVTSTIADFDARTAVSPRVGRVRRLLAGPGPDAIAEELGFAAAAENSIDATAARDFAAGPRSSWR